MQEVQLRIFGDRCSHSQRPQHAHQRRTKWARLAMTFQTYGNVLNPPCLHPTHNLQLMKAALGQGPRSGVHTRDISLGRQFFG